MMSWNVDGILSKFDDPNFVQYIQSFSFISLCETFVEYLDFAGVFQNFSAHILPAKKLSAHGHRSGGIICFVHKAVEKHFVRLECR